MDAVIWCMPTVAHAGAAEEKRRRQVAGLVHKDMVKASLGRREKIPETKKALVVRASDRSGSSKDIHVMAQAHADELRRRCQHASPLGRRRNGCGVPPIPERGPRSGNRPYRSQHHMLAPHP